MARGSVGLNRRPAALRPGPGCRIYTYARDTESAHWAMIRAASNSVSQMAVFPLQDVLGLGSEQRMNLPGTLGTANWSWRFTWPMLGGEPARRLGVIAAASGRGPIELLR